MRSSQDESRKRIKRAKKSVPGGWRSLVVSSLLNTVRALFVARSFTSCRRVVAVRASVCACMLVIAAEAMNLFMRQHAGFPFPL